MPSSPAYDLCKRITLPQKPEGWGYAFASNKHLVSLEDAQELEEVLLYHGNHSWLVTTPQSDTFEIVGQRPIETYLPTFERPTSPKTIFNALWNGVCAEHPATIVLGPLYLLALLALPITFFTLPFAAQLIAYFIGFAGFSTFQGIWSRLSILTHRMHELYQIRAFGILSNASKIKRFTHIRNIILHAALVIGTQMAIWSLTSDGGDTFDWIFQDFNFLLLAIPFLAAMLVQGYCHPWVSIREVFLLTLLVGAIQFLLCWFLEENPTIFIVNAVMLFLVVVNYGNMASSRMKMNPLWFTLLVQLFLVLMIISLFITDETFATLGSFVILPYAVAVMLGGLKPKSKILNHLHSQLPDQIPFPEKLTRVTFEDWKKEYTPQ